jgi:hypothetical protein
VALLFASWADVMALLAPADAARLAQNLGTAEASKQKQLGEGYLERAEARVCSWLRGADYAIPTAEELTAAPIAAAYLKAWTIDCFMYEISAGFMGNREAVAAALARAERPGLRGVRGFDATGAYRVLFYPESLPGLERAA